MRNTSRIREAIEHHEAGWGYRKIAKHMGVCATTIRCWVDPGYYSEHRKAGLAWHALRRKAPLTDEQRESIRIARNQRYVEKFEPVFRELVAQYGKQGQSIIARDLRGLVLAHADRQAPAYTPFITAATGVTSKEFTELLNEKPLQFIRPLTEFDLTEPIQLCQALHLSNIAGTNVNGAEDASSPLPYSPNPEALTLARNFIARELRQVKRYG